MRDQLKIILAEDDRDDSFLFQEALNRMPIETRLHLAQDGELFIEMLHTQDIPDFIFLDLNMPKKDGYSCLVEIRSIKKMEKVPVIIMSTSSHAQSIQRAYEAGADMYVRKPDNFADLVKIIDFCLQQQSLYPDKPPIESFFLVI
jgi:DNA-binding response OmpR family regulator